MYTVAIAGATGAVGQEMLDVMDQRDFPVDELVPLASPRSKGKEIPFRGSTYEVEVLGERSFEDVDLVLSSCGSGVIVDYVDDMVRDGALVVDNSSAFRYDEDIPLIVPEINPHAIDEDDDVIANPNCSTTQLVLALAPVHEQFGIDRMVVSTYQSTSGAGGTARDECFKQTRAVVNEEPVPEPEEFPHQIAFNSIPEIGDVLDDHDQNTKEEMKMVWETRKILEDDGIDVSPTAIRIPVLNCHGESVNVQTDRPFEIDEVRQLMDDFDGVTVQDDPHNSEYPTNLSADGEDDVYVGRIRPDSSAENAFNCWIVADNLRKGAALNTVQIGEHLIEQGHLPEKQAV
jgi:aspartate-semialdehyde dehydrogenase